MLQPGFGWLSYRLFTELSSQDWHWNPAGAFSAGNAGYWTSSAVPGAPIADSFGYRLPHRGSTTDQGNNADYSRIDDGDPKTYWKSNPYLTSAFTGESEALHPQWVVADLNAAKPVNAVRIAWGSPYATAYRVSYWTGSDAIGDPAHGSWKDFPQGAASNGQGSTVTLRLARKPINARFVRVLMSRSSNTCDSHGAADKRNCVGYAIEELSVGVLRRTVFSDYVHHAPLRRIFAQALRLRVASNGNVRFVRRSMAYGGNPGARPGTARARSHCAQRTDARTRRHLSGRHDLQHAGERGRRGAISARARLSDRTDRAR